MKLNEYGLYYSIERINPNDWRNPTVISGPHRFNKSLVKDIKLKLDTFPLSSPDSDYCYISFKFADSKIGWIRRDGSNEYYFSHRSRLQTEFPTYDEIIDSIYSFIERYR